jgi:hypothetical protein
VVTRTGPPQLIGKGSQRSIYVSYNTILTNKLDHVSGTNEDTSVLEYLPPPKGFLRQNVLESEKQHRPIYIITMAELSINRKLTARTLGAFSTATDADGVVLELAWQHKQSQKRLAEAISTNGGLIWWKHPSYQVFTLMKDPSGQALSSDGSTWFRGVIRNVSGDQRIFQEAAKRDSIAANDASSEVVFTVTSTQLIGDVPTVAIEGVFGNPEAARSKGEDVMEWYRARVAMEERAKSTAHSTMQQTQEIGEENRMGVPWHWRGPRIWLPNSVGSDQLMAETVLVQVHGDIIDQDIFAGLDPATIPATIPFNSSAPSNSVARSHIGRHPENGRKRGSERMTSRATKSCRGVGCGDPNCDSCWCQCDNPNCDMPHCKESMTKGENVAAESEEADDDDDYDEEEETSDDSDDEDDERQSTWVPRRETIKVLDVAKGVVTIAPNEGVLGLVEQLDCSVY